MSYQQAQEKRSDKCKYCGLDQILKWTKYLKDDGTQGNKLIYSTDSKPHFPDCKKLQNGEITKDEILNSHRAQGQSTIQQPPQQETQTNARSQLDSIAIADILRNTTETKTQVSSLTESINAIKELMWQIPEVRKFLEEKNNFVSASEHYKQEQKPVLPANKDFEQNLNDEEKQILKPET